MLNQSGQSSWADPVRATQAGGYHARYVYEQPSKTRHEKLESLAKFDTVDVDNANGELVTTIYKLRLVISLPCTKNEHKWNSIKSAHAACVMKPWQTCHSFNHWKHLWPWRLTIVLLAYHKMQEQMAFTATWLGIKESLSHSAKDWLHDTVLHICCHRVSYWLAWAVWLTSYMRHTKKCKWHFSWYNSSDSSFGSETSRMTKNVGWPEEPNTSINVVLPIRRDLISRERHHIIPTPAVDLTSPRVR